jgi:hypothetical protein
MGIDSLSVAGKNEWIRGDPAGLPYPSRPEGFKLRWILKIMITYSAG